MSKISRKVLILFIVVVISGCVSTRSIRYETFVRQPKSPNYPIEILDPMNISRPYKVIGVVQVKAGKFRSTEDVIEHLKVEARKMGGDALIDLQQCQSKDGVIVPVGNMYIYKNVREIWSAKVIVWE